MTKNDFYAGREVCILHNTSNSIGFDQDKTRYQKGTVLTGWAKVYHRCFWSISNTV